MTLLTACRGQATPAVQPTATSAPPTVTQPAAATTAAPTQQPAASETPAATATVATATPTVMPATATLAATATPDANEGVGDVMFQDPLDGTGGWFWTFQDSAAAFGVDAGQLRGTITQADAGWYFTSSNPTLRFGSQQARLTTHAADCAENDEYGLMFHVREAGENVYDAYLFKLRCGGAARFELIQASATLTPIVDWTPSPAIQAGAPADNTLLIWARGGEFRLYVNDDFLFAAQDATLADGYYGIYLHDQTDGGLAANFEDLVVRSVAAP